MKDGEASPNIFAAGEIMAGNILGKGYLAGIGMTIGAVFGRIAGRAGCACRTTLSRTLDTTTARDGASATRAVTAKATAPCSRPSKRRTVFSAADLSYLANLCHNCAECYYACPYTPPHEFAVNVPKLFAEIRAQSYRESAWPHWYGGASLPALVLSALVFLWGARSGTTAAADFYGVVPHSTMIAIFGFAAALVFAIADCAAWRDSGVARVASVAPSSGDAVDL